MDLLLTRYSDIRYILEMDFEDGVEIINKAIEKSAEQRDWEIWVSLYPHFDKKSFISFEKFSKGFRSAKKPMGRASKEEIICKSHKIWKKLGKFGVEEKRGET
jgi:hypothetical protein